MNNKHLMGESNNCKQQIINLLDKLNAEELETIFHISCKIISGEGIQIHIPNVLQPTKCRSNIDSNIIKVKRNEPHNCKIPLNVPYTLPITVTMNENIIANGIPYVPAEKSRLVKTGEIIIRKGDKVVYRGYEFYVVPMGAMSKLYITEEDYNNNTNKICVQSKYVSKIVLDGEAIEKPVYASVNINDLSSSDWSDDD